MIQKIIITTFFILTGFLYSQDSSLNGKWILEKITYTNGKDLEINHPYYSVILEQDINDNMIKGNQIQIGFNKFNFLYLNNRLILNSPDDDLKYYYVKEKRFLELFPEFYPKETIYKERKLFKSNEIIHPIFKDWGKFNSNMVMFLRNKNLGKKFQFDLYIIVEKNSKNYQYYIENSNMSEKQEEQVFDFLEKNKFNVVNNFGQDLLSVFPYNFNFNELNNSKFKKYADEENYLRKLYSENKFKELIKRIKKLEEENFFNNSGYGRLRNVMLGVSYLALNQNDEACKAFLKEGDITTPHVRNYLKNFCQKN